ESNERACPDQSLSRKGIRVGPDDQSGQNGIQEKVEQSQRKTANFKPVQEEDKDKGDQKMMGKDFTGNQQGIAPGLNDLRRIKFPFKHFEGSTQAARQAPAQISDAFDPEKLIHQQGVFQRALFQ